MLWCSKDGNGVRFRVHLTPRSSKDEIQGLYQDALKVRVKAPPVDGKANEALVRFLAKALGTSSSSVEVVSGHGSRMKTLKVTGISPADVISLFGRNL